MADLIGAPDEWTLWPGGAVPSIVNFTINGTTDALEFIYQAHEDMTIVDVGFRQGTVTGTSPVYKASLQGVADGIPDGVILGGGSPASVTFTPVSGGNTTWQWKTLDNPIAVTRGQWIALVIAYDSGTINTSNCCSFAATGAIVSGANGGGGYSITNDAGSRTKAVNSVFGYASSEMAYGYPLQAVIASNFNSGSTPDEKGNLINVPTSRCSTYKISGLIIYGAMAAATSYDIVLYASDGSTVLQSGTIDADNDQQSTAARRRIVYFPTSTLSTLNAGTDYYFTVKPGATNISVAGLTVATADDMDAYVGGSAVCHAATKTDGGSFTLDTTTRYGVVPLFDNLTIPSPSGGGAVIVGAGGVIS